MNQYKNYIIDLKTPVNIFFPQTTYAWGSPDIISVFTQQSANNPIVANAYAPEIQDISGETSTVRLDKWVFDKVTEFLHQDNQKLADKNRTVFFLHLLGLDTGLYDLIAI